LAGVIALETRFLLGFSVFGFSEFSESILFTGFEACVSKI